MRIKNYPIIIIQLLFTFLITINFSNVTAVSEVPTVMPSLTPISIPTVKPTFTPSVVIPLSANSIYNQLKEIVLQVMISISASSSKISYGSGFIIDREGYIVTNYHVVSKALFYPNSYKVYINENSASIEPIEAKIISFDIVHDLALLKVNKNYNKFISLAREEIQIGEKIYSIGVPQDLNMSIIEGVFNGIIAKNTYQTIHLSAPINSGMSGGPTVNSFGELIGVNVSKLLNASNISFAVPLKYVQEIIACGTKSSTFYYDLNQPEKDKNINSGIDQTAFYNSMQDQIIETQDTLINDLKKETNTSNLYNFIIPDTSKHLNCWAEDRSAKVLNLKKQQKNPLGNLNTQRYKIKTNICFLPHEIHLKESKENNANNFVGDDITVGTYNYTYQVIKNISLNDFQLFALYDNEVSSFINPIRSNSQFVFTNFPCSTKIVFNKNAIPFSLSLCLAEYPDFPYIYLARINAMSLLKNSNNIHFFSALYGFTFENIKEYIKYHLNTIKVMK